MAGARPGTVYVVGAGPGDPGLLTLRAHELLSSADLVVHDGLVAPGILALAREDAEVVPVGERPPPRAPVWSRPEGATARLESRLVEAARAGRSVVRLTGGDPLLFGRGDEEALVLSEAGVPFELVPGITAAAAAFAWAGIAPTHRDRSSAVCFASALSGGAAPVDWDALARIGTVVLYMAEAVPEAAVEALLARGRPVDEPAAAVSLAGRPGQRVVEAPLAGLPGRWREARLAAPALLVVGEGVALRDRLAWRERRPLDGRTVVVTRPAHQAAPLVETLIELGAAAVSAPAIAIADPEDPAPLDAALRGLSGYDLVVFASPNAVERVGAALGRLGLDARAFAGARLAAVGTATAEALDARGLRADVVPERQDADGLLSVLAETLPGRRVLVPRAAEGRETFPEGARALGARVDVVTAYRTVRRPEALAALRPRLEAGEIDAFALTSPSQVGALVEGLGDDAPRLLDGVLLACIGTTTLKAVEAAGLVGAAPEHFAQGPLLELIVDRLGRR